MKIFKGFLKNLLKQKTEPLKLKKIHGRDKWYINGILDPAEERNSELEDKSEEITQNAEQKDEEMQNIKADKRVGGQVRKSQPNNSPGGRE